MNINTSITFEEFIDKLNNKFNGAIDSNTYDYDILYALYNLNEEVDTMIENFLNSLSFENKTGNELDRFLEFFNFNRIQGNNSDIYELSCVFNTNNSLIIKKDSIILFEGNNYKVIKDIVLNDQNSTIVSLQKTFSSYNFINPVYSAGGIVCFDKSGIEIQGDSVNIAELVSKYLKVISLQIVASERESDLEFLERSKSIMQSLGYSNNEKIKYELLKDNRINNLSFLNKSGVTEITIFPNNLNEIDEIIDYAQEIVDYYKCSNILLLKPNIDEINIIGLTSQIVYAAESEKILFEINSELIDYLSNLLINNTIVRNEIIKIIKDVIEKYTTTLDINYSNIKIYNYFYYRNNYDQALIATQITEQFVLSNNVLSLGEIE